MSDLLRKGGIRRLVAAAACLCLVGCCVPAGAAEPSWTRAALPWSLVQSSPTGRSLQVSFFYGGCERNPRAVAVEHQRSVQLAVTIEDQRGAGVACPAFAARGTTRVALAKPLGGRRVLGGQHPQSGGFGAPSVPWVIGLAPADARTAIELGVPRLRVQLSVRHGHGGLPRVSSQAPPGGTAARRDETVRLQVLAP